MGRLNKVAEYRDPDRLLTEQFIHGLYDDGITDKIKREVATLEIIDKAMSEHMLG